MWVEVINMQSVIDEDSITVRFMFASQSYGKNGRREESDTAKWTCVQSIWEHYGLMFQLTESFQYV